MSQPPEDFADAPPSPPRRSAPIAAPAADTQPIPRRVSDTQEFPAVQDEPEPTTPGWTSTEGLPDDTAPLPAQTMPWPVEPVTPQPSGLPQSPVNGVVPVSPSGEVAPPGSIESWPPLDAAEDTAARINPKTGEPRRPILIWLASALGFVSTIVVAVAIGNVLWNSIESFAQASWVNGRMETDPGSWVRVAFSVINTFIAITAGGVTAFFGYHVFVGRDWTRWFGIVATVVSGVSLLLTWQAAVAIIPMAIAAVLVWLPPARRYFNVWKGLRAEPDTRLVQPDAVFYGPLPRYR